MPLQALALVLAAALLHAAWNVAAKRTGGDHHFAFVSSLFVSVLWAPVAWWFGADELSSWGWREWAIVSVSAFVHVVYFLTLLRGYREADLTVVYPVARGSGPLLTALVAVLLLGERLSPLATAGVLAVGGGIFLIAGGASLLRGGARPRVLAGLRWGVATGALIAMYTVIDGYAVKFMLMGPVLFDWVCNVLRLPLQAPLVWRDRGHLREVARTQWKPALIVAMLGPLGYILVLTAVTMAPLSHVAPAREVSLLFAALIGGHLLGEMDRGSRLAGAGCIAAGVAALALG